MWHSLVMAKSPTAFVFTDQLAEISARYKSAPLLEANAVEAWKALRNETIPQFESLQRGGALSIEIVCDPEPYSDAAEMFADMDRGRILISSANSEHPIWTVEENVAFRAVHDILGHGVSRSDFSWEGENLACSAHAPLLSQLAKRALFTECIAQTAYVTTEGYFGEQKTVLLDDEVSLRRWSLGE